jgi:hypothetical protein
MRVLTRLCLLLLLTRAVGAQELSVSVYPSIEELIEAERIGEIDLFQLFSLEELSQLQFDSASLFLQDRIPNLSYFSSSVKSLEPTLRSEQRTPFMQESSPQRTVSGRFRHVYNQRFTDEQSRYRSSARLLFPNSVAATFDIRRDYSGRERIVRRSVSIRPDSGVLKEIVLGNFSARYGLGTIIGYRGRLVEPSTRIDERVLLPAISPASFWRPLCEILIILSAL